MTEHDATLATDVAAGPGPASAEQSAWVESVYESYARELWAVLYAQCCDPDLTRDAVQEAFLRLQRQDRNVVRDARAWLVRVGRNWLRDVARRRRNAARPSEFLDGVIGTQPEPIRNLEADETQGRVRESLARLREDDRQVLVLRYALDWSSARIAETLDSTPAAIDMRLSRARKRLAELLTADGFPIPGRP